MYGDGIFLRVLEDKFEHALAGQEEDRECWRVVVVPHKVIGDMMV
jgi:hypothetical protein